MDEKDHEIARLKAMLEIMNDIKKQRDQMQQQLKEHQFEREKLTQRIEELIRESRLMREQDEKHFKDLMEKIKNLEGIIAQKDRVINDKDTTIKDLSSKNLEMQ